jgi:hypothetical protein
MKTRRPLSPGPPSSPGRLPNRPAFHPPLGQHPGETNERRADQRASGPVDGGPDADSLRVLVGQATASKGPMSAEEFIAFARELLDAARKAEQTA